MLPALTTSGTTGGLDARRRAANDLLEHDRSAMRSRVLERTRHGVSQGGRRGQDRNFLAEAEQQRDTELRTVDACALPACNGDDDALLAEMLFGAIGGSGGALGVDGGSAAGHAHPLRDALVGEARRHARQAGVAPAALAAPASSTMATMTRDAAGGGGSRSAWAYEPVPPPPSQGRSRGGAPAARFAAVGGGGGSTSRETERPRTHEQAKKRRPVDLSSAEGVTPPAAFLHGGGGDGALTRAHVVAATAPNSRADVVASMDALENALRGLPPNPAAVDRMRVYDGALVDLVRQNLVGCVERGVLLEFVRVALFGCVNEVLADLEETVHRAAASEAVVEGLERQIREQQCEMVALREQRVIEQSNSRRKEILEITSQAKRSKEYVAYATAHFNRASAAIAQEESDAEVRHKYFSMALKANTDQKVAQDRYQEALEDAKKVRDREDKLRAIITKQTSEIEGLKSYVDKLKLRLGDSQMTESVRRGPRGRSEIDMFDLVDVATGLDDAEADVADACVDTEDLEPPRRFSIAPRHSVFGLDRRKSSFMPALARARQSFMSGRKSIALVLSPTSPIVVHSEDDDDEKKSPKKRSTRVRFDDEKPSVGVQATPQASDVTGVAIDASEMRADFAAAFRMDAAATIGGASEWLDCGWLVHAETQTDGGSKPIVKDDMTFAPVDLSDVPVSLAAPGRRRASAVPELPDTAFDTIARRLPLDKAKLRPPKWVISTASQVLAFVAEQDSEIGPSLDVSAAAVLYFRSKYGLEKLSDQYVAEFIVGAQRELFKSRRIGCFVRFVGLQKFLELPEALEAGGVDVAAVSTRQALLKSTASRSTTAKRGPASLTTASGGGGGPRAVNVALPWTFFAHYCFLLANVKRLIPRKALKELEEQDTFELPAFGAFQLLRHAYKKRLSEHAIKLLADALNEFDRTVIVPGALAPVLHLTHVPAEGLSKSWPVDLLLEVLAFSTDSLFPDLLRESVPELAAANIRGIDDPRMWNPAV